MRREDLQDALEKHDALLRACVQGELSVREFLVANDCFYLRWALDGHEGGQAVLDEFSARIEVHRQVWERVESRITSELHASSAEHREAGLIGEQEALERLQAIAWEGDV